VILTKEQVEKRLASPDNLANKIKEDNLQVEVIIKDGKNHSGRPGSHNLTDNERVAIGVLANTVGNELAGELMGVTERTARSLKDAHHTYSDGRGTQRHGEDIELKDKIAERIESTKLTIQERAAEKLLAAMGALTEDKLENCTPKDAAQISNQMSQVMRNMSSNNNSKEGGKQAVKIILHQPKTSRESSFETLEIGVGV